MISGQSVSILFQAVYFVLIGRTLGSQQYGLFVGVAALVQVLSNFSTLGMEVVMVRDTSRDKLNFARTFGASLLVAVLGFFVILLAALGLGHFLLRPELLALLPFVTLSDALCGKIVQIASRAFQGFSMLSYTARLNAATNIARAVTAAILSAYVYRTHIIPTAYTWTKIYWLSSLFVATISLLLVITRLGWPTFGRISGRDLGDGFSFSISSSSISVYNDIDKTLMVSFGQINAAGIYAAAYRIVDVASTPIYGIYTAAFPRFFQEGAIGVQNAFRLAHRLLKKTALYGIAVAAIMFFGARLLPLVLGPSFEGSVGALRWLCLLPLIRCFHYAAGSTITGSSSQWYRTSSQIFAALANLGLNVVLIPRFSWRGAAAASLLTDGGLALINWMTVLWLISRENNKSSSTPAVAKTSESHVAGNRNNTREPSIAYE
jgi:O-antigen/teichoic acid export membrane protein